MGKIDWKNTVYSGLVVKIALIDDAVVDVRNPDGTISKSIYFKKDTKVWREIDSVVHYFDGHQKMDSLNRK